MEAVIGLIISCIGAHFTGMDFCTLYTFISTALLLYKDFINHTNDKTALR